MIDGHAHAEVGGPLRANGEALGQTSAGNSQGVGAGRLAPTKAEKLGPARAPGLAHANAGKLERLLRPNPFSGDLGEMSADMAEALAAPDPGSSIKGIVAALTDGRVLVPALPHEHPGRTEDGGIAEHVSEPDPTAGAVAEAATLSVRIPGGRFAMPVFSCAERLVACYPGARPIPVLGRDIAPRALMASGVLALDPRERSGEGCIALGRSAVASVAAGQEWVAPWDDPRVLDGFEEALADGGHSAHVDLTPTRSGIIRLYVRIEATTEAEAYNAVTTVVSAAENNPYLRAHLDVVEIVPMSANSHG